MIDKLKGLWHVLNCMRGSGGGDRVEGYLSLPGGGGPRRIFSVNLLCQFKKVKFFGLKTFFNKATV